VIFATVGTHGQPFARFLDLVRELDDDVVLQYGHNPPPAGFRSSQAFVPFDEVLRLMREARAVVTHAGVGSILCAREAGHIPVVIPRLPELGEHVDAHQSELTRTLAAQEHVIAVWGGEGLAEAVELAVTRRTDGFHLVERPIHAAVRSALLTP
jgi:UDP-N-acetylglucosamine transferase subunit ALG13